MSLIFQFLTSTLLVLASFGCWADEPFVLRLDRNVYLRTLITKGSTSVARNYGESGKPYLLKAGSTISVPPELRPYFENAKDKTAALQRYIEGKYPLSKIQNADGTKGGYDHYLPVSVLSAAEGSTVVPGANGLHLAVGSLSRKGALKATQNQSHLRPQSKADREPLTKTQQLNCETAEGRAEALSRTKALYLLRTCQAINVQVCQDYGFATSSQVNSTEGSGIGNQISDLARAWSDKKFDEAVDAMAKLEKTDKTSLLGHAIYAVETASKITGIIGGKGVGTAAEILKKGLNLASERIPTENYCTDSNSVKCGPGLGQSRALPFKIGADGKTGELDASINNPFLHEFIKDEKLQKSYLDLDSQKTYVENVDTCLNLIKTEKALKEQIRHQLHAVMDVRISSPKCGSDGSLSEFYIGDQHIKMGNADFLGFKNQPAPPEKARYVDIQSESHTPTTLDSDLTRFYFPEGYPANSMSPEQMAEINKNFVYGVEHFSFHKMLSESDETPKWPSPNGDVKTYQKFARWNDGRIKTSWFNDVSQFVNSYPKLQQNRLSNLKSTVDQMQFWTPRANQCCHEKSNSEDQQACFSNLFGDKLNRTKPGEDNTVPPYTHK